MALPGWIQWKIDLVHIQPGKPTQNGGMESFNGKLRDECLNTSWFWNLFDAMRKICERSVNRILAAGLDGVSLDG